MQSHMSAVSAFRDGIGFWSRSQLYPAGSSVQVYCRVEDHLKERWQPFSSLVEAEASLWSLKEAIIVQPCRGFRGWPLHAKVELQVLRW